MFSGIVEELGAVKSLNKQGAVYKLRVAAAIVTKDINNGQSICVNGVCLTVVEVNQEALAFDIMPESINRANLARLKPGEKVNLERAVKSDGRFDGHFVSGHIDGQGVIARLEKRGDNAVITLKTSPEILGYIALKGSVALDGVSLTVSGLSKDTFSVSLIPYTLRNTTLGLKKEKDTVNIETDILSKYIGRILSASTSSPSNITASFLREEGFM